MKPTRLPTVTALWTAGAVALLTLGPAGCVNDGVTSNRRIRGSSTPGNVARIERAQDRVEVAERLVEQGRLDAALAEFGLALEDNPDLLDAHMGMGGIYELREEPEIALRLYQQAVQIDDTNARAHYKVGLMQQLLGRLNEAITSYLRSLALDPNQPEPNRDLATAYVQVGRPDYAISFAQKATDLNPDEQISWVNLATVFNMLGDYEAALRCYRVATELGPLDDPVLLGLADTHLKLGNYQRAANTLESVIRTRPTSTAFERLGYSQFKRRDFGEALKHYRTAVQMNPNEAAAYNGIGAVLVTYYIQGDSKNRQQLEEALNAWRTSLRIRPQQPAIVDLLARYQRPG